MPLRVLIVPDKFKGTLTAAAAADAIADGWMQARAQDDLELLPMSDGGDGFGTIVAALIGAEARTVETVDAANRPLQATWWYEPGSATAVIESAGIIGLALLPPGRFHPFELDTRGLAAVVREAWDAGAQQVIMGVGGSATNDGGFGIAAGLGWEFLDANGLPIERWIKLDRLARWEPARALPQVNLVVAVDVDNPLLGGRGCSRVYGPQKGLRTEQAPLAEACLKRLAEMAHAEFGSDIAAEPGAGAAGGLGFGLKAFLGARIESGFQIFSRLSGLEERVAQADLIITAEGALDRQTYMGKGTGQVAQLCVASGKRCVGLGGMVEGPHVAPGAQRLFHSVNGIAPGLTSPAESKANPAQWLKRLTFKVAQEYVE
jgi:glycerate 2-kinase